MPPVRQRLPRAVSFNGLKHASALKGIRGNLALIVISGSCKILSGCQGRNGLLVHMGWKVRRSKDEDVCMALDVIIALMKESGIDEVCHTDEVRGRKRRAQVPRPPKQSGPAYRDA